MAALLQSAALILSLLAWPARYYFKRDTIGSDFFIFSFLLYLRNVRRCNEVISRIIILPSASILVVAASTLALGIAVLTYGSFATENESLEKTGIELSESPLKPMFFPCQTAHARFFPKKHSFRYSYLLAGVPVGWQGSIGGIIAADQQKASLDGGSKLARKAWFSIEAEDYLYRGDSHLGLRGKLDAYLETQGAEPKKYPYAYLVTAPRFWGYSFNPISFWYLYSGEKELTAMVLEVNNTFDERRMYFLPKDEGNDFGVQGDGFLRQSEDVPSKFSSYWKKDFHVSPFNSRKGSYSVSVHDLFAPALSGPGKINNIVTLHSSKEHIKLVATISSTSPALAAADLSTFQKLRFVLSWWWVGFMTSPRIIYQAGHLYFRRKLHVWFRPEPVSSTLGRHETREEAVVERAFRSYLRNHVENTSSPLRLQYQGSGMKCAATETFSSRAATRTTKTIDLKILTPAFYTHLVRYAHISEAIVNLYLSCPENEKMIHVSDPSFLHQLASLPLMNLPELTAPGAELLTDENVLGETLLIRLEHSGSVFSGWRKRWRWDLVRKLRRGSIALGTASKSGDDPSQAKEGPGGGYTSNIEDIRVLPLSALDLSVLSAQVNHATITSSNTQADADAYLNAVLLTLLADRNAWGLVPLLHIYDLLLRALVIADATTWVSGLVAAAAAVAYRQGWEEDPSRVTGGKESLVGMLFAGLGVHMWDLGKWFVLG